LHAFVQAWAALAAPWQASLELAWEAYRAGTVPVGAVVVDGEGEIVARGRNRIFEDGANNGTLAGTRLAHAEVNALAQLPSSARYESHTIYAALEPCLLCLGATLMSTVGAIRYAAADPAGGACRATIRTPDLERRGLAIDGPLEGWPSRLVQTLSVAFWLTRASARYRWILDAYGPEQRSPAARLLALGDPGEQLEEALPRLLPLL
jgi:tRNA(Arg) A34 adenosine deaminase TadA